MACQELNEEEYSPESWKLVRDYYDAAVAMRDGSYPQNAVTVAAWQLLDRVRELMHDLLGDKHASHMTVTGNTTMLHIFCGICEILR